MKGIIKYRICFLLLLLTANSFSAVRTWTGTTSTNWADASNWGGTLPSGNDDVNIPTVVSGRYPVISTTVTLTGSTMSINSNNGAGASLTIISGGSFTTGGAVTIRANGTLTITGGTALFNGITISGNFYVQGGTINSVNTFTLSGGTFTQSDGVIHMAANTGTNPTDNFAVSSGNFTQSGGTFYVKDFSATGGTFNQTSSLALFRIYHDWKPNSAHTFNSTLGTVQYSGASGTAATFTSTNSQFNNIIVDASIDPGFDNDANSSVKISGDLTNNNSSLNNGTNITFTFNGSGTQTIISSSADFFGKLTINKTGGIVNLASGLSVTNTLTMTEGNISTGSNILALGTSTTARGTLTYSSGIIFTGNTGGFKRWFTNAAASNVLFPVGTSVNNNTVTISFTSAPAAGGSLTAKFIDTDPGTNSTVTVDDAGYTIDRYGSVGYWQLDAANGLAGGTYSLSLKGEGFNTTGLEITNYTKLRILKRSGPGNDWTVQGTHLNATGSNLNPTIQRSGLSGFSQFAMGGNEPDGNPLQGPLPVELTQFSSSVNANSVVLNWVTESEKNNKGFDIFRKDINSGWQKIGFVECKGNGNTHNMYSYSDINLSSNTYYYKLKQIDFNGNYKFYLLNAPVIIGIPAKYELKQNYPNPFNPSTRIQYSIPNDAFVTLKIYDESGREIANLVNTLMKAGIYSVNFNAGLYNLSSGIYFYKISAGNYSNIKKLVLIK
jgi:hypothetical protein